MTPKRFDTFRSSASLLTALGLGLWPLAGCSTARFSPVPDVPAAVGAEPAAVAPVPVAVATVAKAGVKLKTVSGVASVNGKPVANGVITVSSALTGKSSTIIAANTGNYTVLQLNSSTTGAQTVRTDAQGRFSIKIEVSLEDNDVEVFKITVTDQESGVAVEGILSESGLATSGSRTLDVDGNVNDLSLTPSSTALADIIGEALRSESTTTTLVVQAFAGAVKLETVLTEQFAKNPGLGTALSSALGAVAKDTNSPGAAANGFNSVLDNMINKLGLADEVSTLQTAIAAQGTAEKAELKVQDLTKVADDTRIADANSQAARNAILALDEAKVASTRAAAIAKSALTSATTAVAAAKENLADPDSVAAKKAREAAEAAAKAVAAARAAAEAVANRAAESRSNQSNQGHEDDAGPSPGHPVFTAAAGTTVAQFTPDVKIKVRSADQLQITVKQQVTPQQSQDDVSTIAARFSKVFSTFNPALGPVLATGSVTISPIFNFPDFAITTEGVTEAEKLHEFTVGSDFGPSIGTTFTPLYKGMLMRNGGLKVAKVSVFESSQFYYLVMAYALSEVFPIKNQGHVTELTTTAGMITITGEGLAEIHIRSRAGSLASYVERLKP